MFQQLSEVILCLGKISNPVFWRLSRITIKYTAPVERWWVWRNACSLLILWLVSFWWWIHVYNSLVNSLIFHIVRFSFIFLFFSTLFLFFLLSFFVIVFFCFVFGRRWYLKKKKKIRVQEFSLCERTVKIAYFILLSKTLL